jgi:hypothetical protein
MSSHYAFIVYILSYTYAIRSVTDSTHITFDSNVSTKYCMINNLRSRVIKQVCIESKDLRRNHPWGTYAAYTYAIRSVTDSTHITFSINSILCLLFVHDFTIFSVSVLFIFNIFCYLQFLYSLHSVSICPPWMIST